MDIRNSMAKQLASLDFRARRFIDRNETPWSGDEVLSRYQSVLGIDRDAFRDKIVVDIGCVPGGSLHCFEA